MTNEGVEAHLRGPGAAGACRQGRSCWRTTVGASAFGVPWAPIRSSLTPAGFTEAIELLHSHELNRHQHSGMKKEQRKTESAKAALGYVNNPGKLL
ncbi:MAG: hypothetical protein FRX49_13794 [Trebouxia sp. A1-2]|nr:MAG: hypothetical protein FRX49_13794 [Trebouxia sp. A1-2]